MDFDFDGIPDGIDDFKSLRDVDAYYIDKTLLIEKILSKRATKVFLFTRPRRFGKSLNLSMLDAYLNKDYAGNTWFDGLRISETGRFDSDKNTNVVINLNLKDLGSTYDQFIVKMGERMGKLFFKHRLLEESPALDDYLKEMCRMYRWGQSSAEMLQSSLVNLSECLTLHHGRPPVILIDEYDDAVNRAVDEAERRKIIDFMREFLSPALKSNPSMRFAVLTGVMQIAKEAFFSGLNNIRVDNIFSKRCDDLFGFTEGEVRKLCEDFGRPDKFEEAKKWYDGYRFGDAEIYNPWSVLRYVMEGFIPGTYWVNTSGNSIIPSLLEAIDSVSADRMRVLLEGGAFIADLYPTIAYSEDLTRNKGAIFSTLAMSGYVNAAPVGAPEKNKFVVSISNKEMSLVFREEICKLVDGMGGDSYIGFVRAAASGDIDKMKSVLIEVLSHVGEKLLPKHDESIEDRSGRFREANYNILVLAMVCVASHLYRIGSDMETGGGRADIFMESRDGRRPNMIMELKWKGDPGADLEKAAAGAIGQIHEKKYHLGLKGRTMLYGIAFRKRDVCIRCEEHSG